MGCATNCRLILLSQQKVYNCNNNNNKNIMSSDKFNSCNFSYIYILIKKFYEYAYKRIQNSVTNV